MELLIVQQFVCVGVHFKHSVGGVLVYTGSDRRSDEQGLVRSTVIFDLQERMGDKCVEGGEGGGRTEEEGKEGGGRTEEEGRRGKDGRWEGGGGDRRWEGWR